VTYDIRHTPIEFHCKSQTNPSTTRRKGSGQLQEDFVNGVYYAFTNSYWKVEEITHVQEMNGSHLHESLAKTNILNADTRKEKVLTLTLPLRILMRLREKEYSTRHIVLHLPTHLVAGPCLKVRRLLEMQFSPRIYLAIKQGDSKSLI
jgi:hypothetical protein